MASKISRIRQMEHLTIAVLLLYVGSSLAQKDCKGVVCDPLESCIEEALEEGSCCPKCAQIGCTCEGYQYYDCVNVGFKDGKVPEGDSYFVDFGSTECSCPQGGGRISCHFIPCPELPPNCIDIIQPSDGCIQCGRIGCIHGGEKYEAGHTFHMSQCKFCHCPNTGGDLMCYPLPHCSSESDNSTQLMDTTESDPERQYDYPYSHEQEEPINSEVMERNNNYKRNALQDHSMADYEDNADEVIDVELSPTPSLPAKPEEFTTTAYEMHLSTRPERTTLNAQTTQRSSTLAPNTPKVTTVKALPKTTAQPTQQQELHEPTSSTLATTEQPNTTPSIEKSPATEETLKSDPEINSTERSVPLETGTDSPKEEKEGNVLSRTVKSTTASVLLSPSPSTGPQVLLPVLVSEGGAPNDIFNHSRLHDGSSKDLIESCCAAGQQWSINFGECENMPLDPSEDCRLAQRQCCLSYIKENTCIAGMIAAKEDGLCPAAENDLCERSHFKLCCDCCSLGLKIRKEGESCESNLNLGYPCNHMMVLCCNGEEQLIPPDLMIPPKAEPTPEPDKDVDECVLNTHTCATSERCVNTVGSFVCVPEVMCQPGFLLEEGVCQDVNECAASPAPCKPGFACVNTLGSYVCQRKHLNCNRGYRPNENGTMCIDFDECGAGTHNCSAEQTCTNLPGSHRCDCKVGYRYDAFRRTCIDVNECWTYPGRLCHHTCENTVGSYRCSCFAGFRLSQDGRHCEDVNECEQNPCNQECTNIYGSYQCYCKEGYKLGDDGVSCKDIDECQQSIGTLCVFACVNTPGSYQCACPENGYTMSANGLSCRDIDECGIGTHNCSASEECYNVLGSYKCLSFECPENYRRVSNMKCERIQCFNYQDCQNTPARISYQRLNFPTGVVVPAQCYMNSVLQQLFFIPHLLEKCVRIRNVDPECNFDEARGALLIELQRVFSHLAFSKKEYYVPKGFWDTFRFFDEDRLDTKQQHDAVDFFTALVDKIDTVLEKLGRPLLFKPSLGGKFAYEYICYGCWHRYTGRDEEFVCVNLELHGETLEECFEHYVDGEILEGDNAYKCEKCDEKRSTLRRGSFKSLPDTLTVQLKRFSYDYTGRQARKNDQFCQFPEILDMTPFTSDSRVVSENELEDLFEAVFESSQGISSVHKTPVMGSLPMTSPSIRLASLLSPAPSPNGSFSRLATAKQRRRISTVKSSEEFRYELVGVLAHHGLAAAGHYYSYVKERRDEMSNSYWYGRWLEANDTRMSEFNGEERERAEQWFGGSFREERARANSFNGNVELPCERTRTWNAYVLFYDRVKEKNMETKERVADFFTNLEMNQEEKTEGDASPNCAMDVSSNFSVEKTAAIFDSMPKQLRDEVNEANMTFLREKALYCPDYISMCHRVTKQFINQMKHKKSMAVELGQFNLKYFTEVCKFFIWWCLHILWRLPEELCGRQIVIDSINNMIELMKIDRHAAHVLADLFLENNPVSTQTYLEDVMTSQSPDVKYHFWDKLAITYMRAMAEEAQKNDRSPTFNSESLLDRNMLIIINYMSSSMPMHRMRPDLGLNFMRRYVSNSSWRMEHFYYMKGMQLIHDFIHTGGEDTTESDFVSMLDEQTSKKDMYTLFYQMLRQCSIEDELPHDWLMVYKNANYWKVAIEGVINYDSASNTFRSDFLNFAFALIHANQLFIFKVVDALCLVAERITGVENFIKLLKMMFDIDRYVDGDGKFIAHCFQFPQDIRVGFIARLNRWKLRNIYKANEFLAAFDEVVSEQFEPEEIIYLVQQQLDPLRADITERNITLDIANKSDCYELPHVSPIPHDDDDSNSFLKGDGVPETISINDIPCLEKERSHDNSREE